MLWLDDNQFEQFPTAICRLTNLKVLRLSGNLITEIPELIQLLTNLETFSMDNNDIREIPDGLLKLRTLKHLWLRYILVDCVKCLYLIF